MKLTSHTRLLHDSLILHIRKSSIHALMQPVYWRQLEIKNIHQNKKSGRQPEINTPQLLTGTDCYNQWFKLNRNPYFAKSYPFILETIKQFIIRKLALRTAIIGNGRCLPLRHKWVTLFWLIAVRCYMYCQIYKKAKNIENFQPFAPKVKWKHCIDVKKSLVQMTKFKLL